MKKYHLNDKHILTWQQAYEWEQLPTKKFICFGKFPLTKEGKEFFAPFLTAGYINKNTLRFTGVFVLTDKGKRKFEQLKKSLDITPN
jgi:hypothetical protein